MKRRYLVLGLLLTMLVTALPAHAASDVFRFQLRGLTAEAHLFASDSCVDTEMLIVANTDVTRDSISRKPTPVARGFIYIYRYDNCTATTLFNGESDTLTILPDRAFQIDRELTTATLNATFEVFDEMSARTVPVEAHLTWTGSDSTVRGLRHDHIEISGLKINYMAAGEDRDAAVSGSVLLGGTNIITPDPRNDAFLESLKIGDLEIVHGEIGEGSLPHTGPTTSAPRQRYLFAEAAFDSSSGLCPQQDTFIYVIAAKDVFRQGDPSAPDQASVSVGRFDCDGFLVFAYEGLVTLPDGAYQIDTTLRSATLNATINLTDQVSGTIMPVDINLSWTATDLSEKDRTLLRIWMPDSTLFINYKSTRWNADASGSVLLGGTDLPLESQYFAHLESVKQNQHA